MGGDLEIAHMEKNHTVFFFLLGTNCRSLFILDLYVKNVGQRASFLSLGHVLLFGRGKYLYNLTVRQHRLQVTSR